MARNNKSTVGVFLGAGNVGRPSRGAKRTLKSIVRMPGKIFKLGLKVFRFARRSAHRNKKRSRK